MRMIERAARALALALALHDMGEDRWDDLDPAMRERFCAGARAVLAALREPDSAMKDAGSEILRAVHKGESDEAYANDAANTWRLAEVLRQFPKPLRGVPGPTSEAMLIAGSKRQFVPARGLALHLYSLDKLSIRWQQLCSMAQVNLAALGGSLLFSP